MAFPQGGPRQPELDFEQILGRIKEALGPIGQKLGGGGVGSQSLRDGVARVEFGVSSCGRRSLGWSAPRSERLH